MRESISEILWKKMDHNLFHKLPQNWKMMAFPLIENNNFSTTPAVPINNYIGPDELCVRETRLKYCNLHTPKRLCICYTPIELMRPEMPFCSRLLPLHTLEHLILTISLAFPMPQSFLLDPDSIFAEDLELFAGFQRNSVLIVRKGCDLTRTSFQFQFGILRAKSQEKETNLSGSEDLRRIWPKLFMANTNFMGQKGLLVESVTQSRYLRPLIGYKDWIYADKIAQLGWGICHKSDPVECYGWEMAFIFLFGIYFGAECIRAILWRILRCRHGRMGQRRRNGRRQASNVAENGREDIGLVELANMEKQNAEEGQQIVVEVEVETGGNECRE